MKAARKVSSIWRLGQDGGTRSNGLLLGRVYRVPFSVALRINALMEKAKYKIILAGEQGIYEKTTEQCEEGNSFIIRADKSFRHTDRLIRMLRSMNEGVKAGRWAWTGALDGWHSARILTCTAVAEDHKYRWRYEYTQNGVDLIFDPPF
jgi:hypothetical protein